MTRQGRRVAIASSIAAADERVARFRVAAEPRLRAVWRELGILILWAVGLAQVFGGVIALKVAIDRLESLQFLSIVAMWAGGGLAILVSGALTFLRRRRELVHKLLGAMTTGTYGLALVFLSSNEGAADGFLAAAVFFGGCLLVTLVFADLIRPEATETVRG